MDKVTLLPCPNPWCGSHDDDAVPEGEDIWQHPALSPVYRVQCPYCPVKGPTASTEQQAITAWNTRATAPDSEKLREALTPSGDTKAAYSGEFKFDVMFPSLDEDDDEPVPHPVTVPWDTIKEIMAAIASRAGASS